MSEPVMGGINFAPGQKEPDHVTVKVSAVGVDDAQAKVDALNKKLAETKVLAAELASALNELFFTFDMNPKSYTINIDGSQLAKEACTCLKTSTE